MKLNSILLSICVISVLLLSCQSESETVDTPESNSTADNGSKTSDAKLAEESSGPFEVKSGVVRFKETNLDGVLKRDRVYSFDNYGALVKLEETIDGEISYYIYNSDTKRGMKLFAGKDKAYKTFGIPGEIAPFIVQQSTASGGFKKRANETIAGNSCTVYQNNAENADGKSLLEVWFYKGMTLKSISRMTKSGEISEAIEYTEKSLNTDDFAFPSGVELPYDIYERD